MVSNKTSTPENIRTTVGQMSLEATIIWLDTAASVNISHSSFSIDNSEHMRNGDFLPTRFEAQHESVNLITGAKTQQHPESAVGILAMASKGNKLASFCNAPLLMY